MKIANLFTGARIALMVPLFYLLAKGPGWAALMVFLAAGLTDIIDGYLARKLNQASRFGAFFDLLADRLLTLVVSVGLIAFHPQPIPVIVACVILLGRNALVAGLNEALPGKVNPQMTWLERFKIGFNFVGFGILMSPPLTVVHDWYVWGELWLCLSALLCLITLLQYGVTARKAFKAI